MGEMLHEQIRVCYKNGRYDYLRLSVPPPEVCMKVKKLEITCTWNDQGWSIYESTDRNTYRNSWTWGDVSIFVTSSEGVKSFSTRARVHRSSRDQEMASPPLLLQRKQRVCVVLGSWQQWNSPVQTPNSHSGKTSQNTLPSKSCSYEWILDTVALIIIIL